MSNTGSQNYHYIGNAIKSFYLIQQEISQFGQQEPHKCIFSNGSAGGAPKNP